MNFNKFHPIKYYGVLLVLVIFALSCTKVEDGFISPTMQYSVKFLQISKGQINRSNALVPDGSSIPINVKWVHIYDETGKIVDDLFTKTYPVEVWSQAYNSLTDNSYAKIVAKRETVQLPPITVNPQSGVVESNSASLNIPTGTYIMDVEVSNTSGTEMLKGAMTLKFVDVSPLQTDESATGYSGSAIALAGTAPVRYLYTNNAVNNPFTITTVTRYADAPNVVYVKIVDRNGNPFNPKAGEVFKRPNTGLNPVPPFLQNLQDYAPDTYEALDTAMFLKYPLAPFPIASLGNSYIMYYNIKASAVIIDSTSAWSNNLENVDYQGTSDARYLGTFKDGRYDYSFKLPMRIHIPGAYVITYKILNVTRK